MNKPRVSVLLTTYNRPKMLRKAIQSVLEQNYQDFELIVLDDNSNDEEQKSILLEYWNHPKVMILKSDIDSENRRETTRYATMVNYGLKIARGEFIAYLCDDDYWYPEKLELIVKYFDERQDVNVIYNAQKCVEINSGEERNMPTPIRDANDVKKIAAFQVDHSSVVHRSKLIETVGYWDDSKENWGHADANYWEKLTDAGHFFHPVGNNIPLDVHVYHEGSWTKDGRLEELK